SKKSKSAAENCGVYSSAANARGSVTELMMTSATAIAAGVQPLGCEHAASMRPSALRTLKRGLQQDQPRPRGVGFQRADACPDRQGACPHDARQRSNGNIAIIPVAEGIFGGSPTKGNRGGTGVSLSRR